MLTAEGQFLSMFGSYGKRRGELDCPVGIAIDTSNRVYGPFDRKRVFRVKIIFSRLDQIMRKNAKF